MTPAPLPERRLVSKEDFVNGKPIDYGELRRIEELIDRLLAERDAAIQFAEKEVADQFEGIERVPGVRTPKEVVEAGIFKLLEK